MSRIADTYRNKFKTSLVKYNEAQNYFPGGVCHDIRSYNPFPVVTERCSDIYMHDPDGNEIFDLWMGHFALLLGHGSESQRRGLARGTEAGIHHGTLNTLQIEFAELIQQAVPELEKFRFCSSGTEATMYVTRVARAYTNRDVIVKVEGGWHGGNSVLSNGIIPPFIKKKNAPEGEKTVSVPYNNAEKTLDILNEYRGEAAAIIMEPMLGAGGGIIAEKDYLDAVRKYCNETGTLLIFDEVITGFRFRYGSIAPLLGVFPDLFTFGKSTAGGMHIGLYGGRADVMSIITKEKLFVGGGTYSANPLTMAAGIETLQTLRTTDYKPLNSKGEELIKWLDTAASNLKIPSVATGYGSYFCLHFLCEEPKAVTPHTLMTCVNKELESEFKAAMLINNVFTMHSGGALSFMHLEDRTIEYIKQAYQKSFEMLDII